MNISFTIVQPTVVIVEDGNIVKCVLIEIENISYIAELSEVDNCFRM